MRPRRARRACEVTVSFLLKKMKVAPNDLFATNRKAPRPVTKLASKDRGKMMMMMMMMMMMREGGVSYYSTHARRFESLARGAFCWWRRAAATRREARVARGRKCSDRRAFAASFLVLPPPALVLDTLSEQTRRSSQSRAERAPRVARYLPTARASPGRAWLCQEEKILF